MRNTEQITIRISKEVLRSVQSLFPRKHHGKSKIIDKLFLKFFDDMKKEHGIEPEQISDFCATWSGNFGDLDNYPLFLLKDIIIDNITNDR